MGLLWNNIFLVKLIWGLERDGSFEKVTAKEA